MSGSFWPIAVSLLEAHLLIEEMLPILWSSRRQRYRLHRAVVSVSNYLYGSAPLILTCVTVGNVGISPGTSSNLTGFGLTLSQDGTYSNSRQVVPMRTRHCYASDYASPTPANLAAAVNDMKKAYTEASTRGPPTQIYDGTSGRQQLLSVCCFWAN